MPSTSFETAPRGIRYGVPEVVYMRHVGGGEWKPKGESVRSVAARPSEAYEGSENMDVENIEDGQAQLERSRRLHDGEMQASLPKPLPRQPFKELGGHGVLETGIVPNRQNVAVARVQSLPPIKPSSSSPLRGIGARPPLATLHSTGTVLSSSPLQRRTTAQLGTSHGLSSIGKARSETGGRNHDDETRYGNLTDPSISGFSDTSSPHRFGKWSYSSRLISLGLFIYIAPSPSTGSLLGSKISQYTFKTLILICYLCFLPSLHYYILY